MLFLLTTAFAGPDEAPEEVPEEAPAGPVEGATLEVKTRVMPQYPPSMLAGNVECTADVVIDTDGRPLSIEVREDGCAEAWSHATEKAFEGWRWEPPTMDGETVQAKTVVKTVFKSATGSFTESLDTETYNTIIRAHAPLDPRAEDGDCAVEATLHQSADVSGLASNDIQSCLVIPRGGKTPKKVWKVLEDAESCKLEFISRDGMIRNLSFTACDTALMKPTEKVLAAWQFNDTKDGRPYALTLKFDPAAPE